MNDVSLPKLLEKWNNYLTAERNYSSNTLSAYQTDIKFFIHFLHNYLNQDITIETLKTLEKSHFRAWVIEKIRKKYNNTSIRRSISSVKSLYKFLALEENNPNILNQVNNIEQIKTSKLLPKPLTQSEIMEVLDILKKINPKSKSWVIQRDYSIILLLYGAGLRISEALSITKTNLHEDSVLVQGKGNKERLLPLLPEIQNEINKYLSLCPYVINKQDPIFLGIRGKTLQARIIQKLIQEIRIILHLPDSFTPHALRHSFASHLFEECNNIRHIQTLLGHEKITSTEIYTKIERELLINQYNQFHPKGKDDTK